MMSIFIVAVAAVPSVDSASTSNASASSVANKEKSSVQLPPSLPQTSRARPPFPIGSPGNWATTADYPAQALRNSKEGTTAFKLVVNASGRITDCEVTESSGTTELDDATCRVVALRATFVPARNAQGIPVEGTYTNKIRWVIPKRMDPPMPGGVVIQYIVERDGHMTDCTVVRSDTGMKDAPQLGPIPCSNQLISPPYVDAQGQPIRKRVISSTTIQLEDVGD